MRNIPLRTVATPVDIFAPDATQLSSKGQGLIGLAGSLSRLSPHLERFARYQNAEERKLGLEQATQLQRERRLDNVNQYKKLVDSGEIEEGDNPWKLVFLRQLVAQEQTSNAALQIEQDLYANPPSDPDDIVGIRNHVQAQMGERLKDLDSFEFQAVSGQVDDFVNRYVSRHQSKRSQERVLEADEALTNKLRSAFDGGSDTLRRMTSSLTASQGSPEGQAGQAYLTELQGTLDAAALTTPAPRVRQRALAVIEEAAIGSRNPELARQLIERLQVDGQGLSGAVTSDWYVQLDERIGRAEVSDMQLAQARDALSRTAALRPVLQLIQEQTAQGNNPFDVPLPSNLPPETLRQVNEFQQLLASRRARGLVSDAAADVLKGTLSSQQKMTLGETLLALDQNASAAIGQIERLRAVGQTASFADTTSPRDKLELDRIKNTPSIPLSQRVDSLLTLADAGRVSESDFDAALSGIYGNAGASGTARAEFKLSVSTRLDALVRPTIPTAYDAATARIVPDPAQLLELEQAKATMRDQLNRFMDLNPQATHEELDAYSEQLLDAASQEMGGMTLQEQRQNRTALKAKAQFESFETGETVDPFSMPNSLRYGGEAGGEFSFQYIGDDGKTVRRNGPAPRFAEDARLFGDREFLSTLFSKLGVDPTRASVVRSLLMTQREHFNARPADRDYLDFLILQLERAGSFDQAPSN